MFNIGTRLTTLIIAATTNPSPIPDRKRIERVPAVFSGIIFVLKTKILIRDVIVRHTRYVPSYRRWGRRGGRRRRRWWSGWRCGALWSTTIQGATRDGFPIPERRTMIVGRVPAVYAKTILRHKTIILLRIVHWCYRRRWSGWGRCWAHWTTIAIAMTTLPFPIPVRQMIFRIPAVFPRIIFVMETKILTRIVPRRRYGGKRCRRWSGWRCGAHGTTIIIVMRTLLHPIPDRNYFGRVPAEFADRIGVQKTIILRRIVHWCCRQRWRG